MPWEQISNFGVTSLASAAASGDGTITVVSAANFPAKGNFHLVIDSEILLVTAVAGVTLTVTRGQEGTAAAAHALGASVLHVNTRGAMDAILARIFCPTVPFVLAVPDPSVFTWQFQQAGATFVNTDDVLALFSPSSAAGGSWTDKALATLTPYTLTAELSFSIPPAGGQHFAGIYVADGAHNAEVGFWQFTGGNLIFNIYKATAINTAAPGFPTALFSAFGQWQASDAAQHRVRVQDDGTNLKWFINFDGIHWQQVYTELRTANITATRAGVVAFSNGGTGGWDTYANVLRWTETTP